MAKLISSVEELEARIREYQKGAEKLAEAMPYNRAWYALAQGKGWIFGPSKFVGYEDLSAEEYKEGEKRNLDGRVTEGVLRHWSQLVTEGHPQYKELHAALSKFCAQFGKKPNTRVRISVVVKGGVSASGPMFPDEIVELMIGVYRKLTPAQKSAFQRQAA